MPTIFLPRRTGCGDTVSLLWLANNMSVVFALLLGVILLGSVGCGFDRCHVPDYIPEDIIALEQTSKWIIENDTLAEIGQYNIRYFRCENIPLNNANGLCQRFGIEEIQVTKDGLLYFRLKGDSNFFKGENLSRMIEYSPKGKIEYEYEEEDQAEIKPVCKVRLSAHLLYLEEIILN